MDASTAAPGDHQKSSPIRKPPFHGVTGMQERRVVKRQGMVLRLHQHLDLGAAEHNAFRPARCEVIHDFKVGVTRAVPENAAA